MICGGIFVDDRGFGDVVGLTALNSDVYHVLEMSNLFFSLVLIPVVLTPSMRSSVTPRATNTHSPCSSTPPPPPQVTTHAAPMYTPFEAPSKSGSHTNSPQLIHTRAPPTSDLRHHTGGGAGPPTRAGARQAARRARAARREVEAAGRHDGEAGRGAGVPPPERRVARGRPRAGDRGAREEGRGRGGEGGER